MKWQLLVFLLVETFANDQGKAPTAIANSGTYVGYWSYTLSGKKYASFSGVRYANPQGRHNRFQLSEVAEDSDKVFPAFKEQSACLQWDVLHLSNYILGQEDCLFANIYSPNVNGSLPVLVAIPSGFFQFGSSSQYINGPEYFMETSSVVLVTFNYRLGPLGFADFHSDKYPANLGLKDQVTFLRWLQRNIAAFGGNPKRVTLQGTSSGAVAAHLHMMSPLSMGLFHAGISESGTGLSYWSVGIKYRMDQRLEALGKQAGCPQPASEALANCLLNMSAYSIFAAYSRMNVKQGLLILLPTVESGNPVGGAFLPVHPFQSPEMSVPWLTGVNSDEAGIFEPVAKSSKALKIFNVMQSFGASLFFTYKDSSADPTLVTMSLMHRYFNLTQPFGLRYFEYFKKVWGYGAFWYPLYSGLRKHNGPKYTYLFSYMETLPNGSLKNPDHKGVWHSEEYFFLFTKQGRIIRKQNPPVDAKMSKILVDMWVNFATYHNPTPAGSNLTRWPLWEEKSNLFISIGQGCNLTAINGPNYEEYIFWTKLPWRNKLPPLNNHPVSLSKQIKNIV